MKTLRVRWKRLVHNNQTCPRCESTGEELEKAISILKEITAPLGIQVVLEKDELPIEAFHENPLESNRIWINGRGIEEWLGGKVGSSPCCDVCGPHNCRTIQVDGKTYETITSDIIVKAGIIAALSLTSKSCCVGDTGDQG
ncbi:MAG: DUF2703 domain-containing protein [Aigarchaeota archaeon]|nr:DUF2703 domain-containing protein [Aigarchaeota archaeon]